MIFKQKKTKRLFLIYDAVDVGVYYVDRYLRFFEYFAIKPRT